MKKFLATVIAILALSVSVYAQTPKGFNYQAVARNSAGQLINNQTLGVRISILQGEMGAPIFSQTSTVSTNHNGLFTLIVGENDPAFESINWERGPYYVQSEVDFNGGGSYTLNTRQKIMAVPYAIYADRARRAGYADSANRARVADSISDNFVIHEIDPQFNAWNYNYNRLNNRPTHLSQFINDLDMLTSGDLVLSVSGDTLFLSGGNYVILPQATSIEWDSVINHPTRLSQFINDLSLSDFVNDLNLYISGDTLFIGDSNFVVLPDLGGNTTIDWDSITNRPTNLSQFINDLNLYINGDTLFVGDGHFVILPNLGGNTTIEWDSIVNRPTNLSQFVNDLTLSISGDTLFLGNGTWVILPNLGTTINWDSITNRPTNLSQFFNDLTISWDSIVNRPTNLSQFNNDITIQWDSIVNRPTNLSQFNNDLGFITDETQGLSDVIAINNNANGQIKNLHTPTDPMDAVNKAYADSILADGLNSVNDRMDSLNALLNDRINNLSGRVDTLYAWFLAHRDSMNSVIAGINNRITNVTNDLQNQLNQANNRIFQLEHPRVKGALNGIFSVSATTKINFSQGNLQYRPRIKTWRFAAHQYDVAGSDNNNVYMQNYCSSWIDLFGYGTSSWDGGAGRFMPYETTTNNSEYTEATDGNDLTGFYANGDWGFYNPIINGGNQSGMWRTLTYSEWTYLLTQRPNASNLKGMATVESTPGFIILPDTWTCPAGLTFVNTDTSYTTNVYSAADWSSMEAAGAVFLPAAGSRVGSVTANIGNIGNYWSASHVNGTTGYSFHIGAGANVMQNTMTYSTGCSVRLVREY